MGLWRWNRTYRNIQRMQAIVNILVKHGFGQLIWKLDLHRFIPLDKKARAMRMEKAAAESITIQQRFRMALEDLGPTFVKFGQVLSTRPDIVPESFIAELKRLQTRAAPISLEQVKRQIEVAFGASVEDVFAEFDTQPVASASIAQVHQAVLKTGEQVVVKVKRPNIDKLIRQDLDILKSLAEMLEKNIAESSAFHPTGLVEQFENSIQRELNLTVEAANTEQFYRLLKDSDQVKTPKVYWNYTFRNILTLERLSGTQMDNIEAIKRSGLDPRVIARRGMQVFLRQILEYGIFHADPHPGNLMVQSDGRIAMIDFGMVGRLDHNMNEYLGMLALGVIEKDYDRIINALQDIGFVFDEENLRGLRWDLQDLIQTYHGLPLDRIGVSDVLNRIFGTLVRYRVDIPPQILMLVRAILVAEGVGRQLDPSIDILAIGRPMVREILERRREPREVLKNSLFLLSDFQRVFKRFPGQLNAIFSRIQRNRLRIEINHQNLDTLSKRIERAGNRLVLGMMIAALFLGSSIIISSDHGPYVFGFPVIGLLGYFVAVVFGIAVLISIIRSSKM